MRAGKKKEKKKVRTVEGGVRSYTPLSKKYIKTMHSYVRCSLVDLERG